MFLQLRLMFCVVVDFPCAAARRPLIKSPSLATAQLSSWNPIKQLPDSVCRPDRYIDRSCLTIATPQQSHTQTGCWWLIQPPVCRRERLPAHLLPAPRHGVRLAPRLPPPVSPPLSRQQPHPHLSINREIWVVRQNTELLERKLKTIFL